MMVSGLNNPTILGYQPLLVGGFNHLEKYEFVNGKDGPFFIVENKNHVPNHQAVIIYIYIYIYPSKYHDN